MEEELRMEYLLMDSGVVLQCMYGSEHTLPPRALGIEQKWANPQEKWAFEQKHWLGQDQWAWQERWHWQEHWRVARALGKGRNKSLFVRNLSVVVSQDNAETRVGRALLFPVVDVSNRAAPW